MRLIHQFRLDFILTSLSIVVLSPRTPRDFLQVSLDSTEMKNSEKIFWNSIPLLTTFFVCDNLELAIIHKLCLEHHYIVVQFSQIVFEPNTRAEIVSFNKGILYAIFLCLYRYRHEYNLTIFKCARFCKRERTTFLPSFTCEEISHSWMFNFYCSIIAIRT